MPRLSLRLLVCRPQLPGKASHGPEGSDTASGTTCGLNRFQHHQTAYTTIFRCVAGVAEAPVRIFVGARSGA
ncbi:hypothetical protein NDU88_004332 [Pleurodeles waltl]|uniref:Uncharacterized protein n=1 Tax=Pleurodeles waltl TaxID=8319 RepID=A0AAV7LUB6_PLEWA|nr:hypothetical protein NDU88_004332 [Pleurodeles waltl]